MTVTPADSPGVDTVDAPLADAQPVDAAIDAAVDAAPPVERVSDFPSVADIFLRTTTAPNENTNNLDYVIVDGDNIATILVRFDLSTLSPTTTVVAAELHLTNTGDTGDTCTVHQLLESWDEATATSNQRSTGTPWMAAGAAPPQSRSTTVAGSFTPATTGLHVVSVDPAIVAGWVTASATNFGFAIATTAADGARFWSREHSTATRRPLLRITHID